MEWADWVYWEPETKTDIKRDCLRLGVPFEDVYPLQTKLF